jgi:hypothetical protein
VARRQLFLAVEQGADAAARAGGQLEAVVASARTEGIVSIDEHCMMVADHGGVS